MHILLHGGTHNCKTYHVTDIGNVNSITVKYWVYPYNGFDTLRNENMQNIFQYVTQQQSGL